MNSKTNAAMLEKSKLLICITDKCINEIILHDDVELFQQYVTHGYINGRAFAKNYLCKNFKTMNNSKKLLDYIIKKYFDRVNLCEAIIDGEPELVQMVLNHSQIDINECLVCFSSRTLLEIAVEHNKLEMVKILLKAGAKISYEPDDSISVPYALNDAIRKNYHDITKELLAATSVNFDCRRIRYNKFDLNYACMRHPIECVVISDDRNIVFGYMLKYYIGFNMSATDGDWYIRDYIICYDDLVEMFDKYENTCRQLLLDTGLYKCLLPIVFNY